MRGAWVVMGPNKSALRGPIDNETGYILARGLIDKEGGNVYRWGLDMFVLRHVTICRRIPGREYWDVVELAGPICSASNVNIKFE